MRADGALRRLHSRIDMEPAPHTDSLLMMRLLRKKSVQMSS
jgi:hypothetical protein